MKRYRITATATYEYPNGLTETRQIPTFEVWAVSDENAIDIADEIVDPFCLYSVVMDSVEI